ncbi:MAG TPA: GxxExxY protein [Gemmatimonadaceae bacterium]|jgi:GxxExxY protein
MGPKRQDPEQARPALVEGELTGRIIACFLRVYNKLDNGMLESVYRNALVVELSHQGPDARTEVPINVIYRDVEVGFFRMDMLVESTVAVEIKSTDVLAPTAKRQLLNYLRVSHLDVGLLLHFGPEPTFHRLESPRLRE